MKKAARCLLLCALAATSAHAAGPYRNPDNGNPNDPLEGTYPVPYKLPVVAEITAQLDAVRGFIDRATPSRIVDRATGQPVTDFGAPVATAIVEPSPNDFGIMNCEMGVMHAGLMLGRRVTGDPKWTAMTERHLGFFHQRIGYFEEQERRFGLGRANSFARWVKPHALDDSGSTCAALVRLKDGTLARNRPQAWSVWADDMYMSIPALAEMGRDGPAFRPASRTTAASSMG